jgi:hypothetical protein
VSCRVRGRAPIDGARDDARDGDARGDRARDAIERDARDDSVVVVTSNDVRDRIE